jgi:hypothetical protein
MLQFFFSFAAPYVTSLIRDLICVFFPSPLPPADFYYNFADTRFYSNAVFAMAMVGIILMV